MKFTNVYDTVEDHDVGILQEIWVRVGRQVSASRGVAPAGSGVADSPAEARVSHVDGSHATIIVKVVS